MRGACAESLFWECATDGVGGCVQLYKGGNAVWSSGTDRSNEKPAMLAVQASNIPNRSGPKSQFPGPIYQNLQLGLPPLWISCSCPCGCITALQLCICVKRWRRHAPSCSWPRCCLAAGTTLVTRTRPNSIIPPLRCHQVRVRCIEDHF